MLFPSAKYHTKSRSFTKKGPGRCHQQGTGRQGVGPKYPGTHAWKKWS